MRVTGPPASRPGFALVLLRVFVISSGQVLCSSSMGLQGKGPVWALCSCQVRTNHPPGHRKCPCWWPGVRYWRPVYGWHPYSGQHEHETRVTLVCTGKKGTQTHIFFSVIHLAQTFRSKVGCLEILDDLRSS